MPEPTRPRYSRSTGLIITMVALLLALAAPFRSHAAAQDKPTARQQLKQAKQYLRTDFDRSRRIAARLNRNQGRLSQQQRTELAYIEALQAEFEGRNSKAIRMYTDIVDQSDDPAIKAKAWMALSALYLRDRNYVKAYTISNTLMQMLPKIRNASVKRRALQSVYAILTDQHQFDKALAYARKLLALATDKAQKCEAMVLQTQVKVYDGGTLASTRDDYDKSIATCVEAGEPSYPNGLRLDYASLMNEEGHPAEALRFLEKIEPIITRSGVRRHIAALHVARAQADLIQGKNRAAIRAARTSIADNPRGSFNWRMQAAYKVLYKAQQNLGNYEDALASYKRYLAQYKASTDDAQAQAIAYQAVKQNVLANQLQVDELAKKNRILQLRQSLDQKSAETNRLYITLLVLVLASIAFWAWRIKHSQVRFRAMARHDDLTGIFNRQHFFDQAGHTLQRLHKAGEPACLMILDMDHFKRINDAYGHVAGDTVLKHVVRTCREQLRDSDLFGRLGGEEFGILMPGCSVAQGTEIGERIRRSLAQSSVQVLESESVTVTCSIGLAGTEIHGHALKPLLMEADRALYGAKRGGRNRLVNRAAQSASIRT